MPISKTKLCVMMTVVCLCLSGCRQQTLAQREIVRAVFFEEEEKQCKAVLLVEDTDLPEGESGYKTAEATANTFEKAIREAEQSLDGTPFYGLMDLAALPVEADWETVTKIGEMLYQQAQPAPEMDLFLVDTEGSPLPKSAGELYDTLRAETEAMEWNGGLERIFVQDAFCALPMWRDGELGLAFLRQGMESEMIPAGLTTQLGAVLCGQMRRIDTYFDEEQADCSAKVTVEWNAEKDGVEILLHLRQATLRSLDGEEENSSDLESKLTEEMQEAFSELNETAARLGADPFRLQFWQETMTGKGETMPSAQLQIEIEL